MLKKIFLLIMSIGILSSCGTSKVIDCQSPVTEKTQAMIRPHESCGAAPLLEETGDFSVLLWGNKNKFWPNNTTLRIKFLNGTKYQQDQTWSRIQKIDEMIGLNFEKVTDGRSDIRIAFNPNGGHWSYIGTDCRGISQSEQTMNIGLRNQLMMGGEWDRVVYHEFLHALGFLHEQQHPKAEIPWDEKKVIEYYEKTQGWSEAQTRQQVLNNRDLTNNFVGSHYDPNSIMHYPVDHFLTTNGYEVGWNEKLSNCDVEILQKVYPK